MKFLEKLWLKIRVYWSNFLYRNDINDIEVKYTTDLSIKGIYYVLVDLYNRFIYKYDDITELFDAMHKPAECYRMSQNVNWKDDCDGFHAAVLHIFYKNNIEAYLLNMVNFDDISKSHTVCVAYDDRLDNWFYCDYHHVSRYHSISKCVEFYKKDSNCSKVFWNLVKFDYEKGKYIILETGEL